MAKRLQEYVKYTIKELDQYADTEGSCVRKVNTNLHLSMGPFCLADFKLNLMAHIVRSKVGYYDVHLGGIVLDVKKVKVLGTTGAMRADDPRLHVNVNADAFVFKPEEGAVLRGVVKHIGANHVGVVLYRVFNANLRVSHKVDTDVIQMDQEVQFRISNYNLQNVFPYIDGELLTAQGETIKTKGKQIFFKDSDNADSGIEEKDGLLSTIKNEDSDEYETPTPKKKSSKHSKTPSDDSEVPEKKSKKKRKSSTSLPDSVTDSSEEAAALLTPKKIKKEEIKSEDEETPKKVKKDKTGKTKKQPSPVMIKQEFSDSDD